MPTGRVTARQGLASPFVPFQRVLAATDFSKGARAALDFALEIAQSFQSQIYLVHVVPTGALQYVAPEGANEVLRQAREFAEREMKGLVREADCAGQVEEAILSGASVWPMLREFIREHSVDLLVLGTHGRSAAKKELLGPVAEEIFRLAESPVLTVGTPRQQGSPKGQGSRRILLATNFKPHAEYAAHFAYALERELKARISVLHVVEEEQDLPKGGQGIVSEFILTRLRKGRPLDCVEMREPKFQVRYGEAVQQILQFAREEQSDFIVLGMRSRKDDAGNLPSAVAYKVACQADCPVLTIRR